MPPELDDPPANGNEKEDTALRALPRVIPGLNIVIPYFPLIWKTMLEVEEAKEKKRELRWKRREKSLEEDPEREAEERDRRVGLAQFG